MRDQEKLGKFMTMLREEHRSHPYQWHDFYIHIKTFSYEKFDDPPIPLILGGSYASPSAKHRQLEDQLNWTIKYRKLDEAIDWLMRLPKEDWDYCNPDDWYKSIDD